MKTIPFSLCIGLALLGSIACGSSSNPGQQRDHLERRLRSKPNAEHGRHQWQPGARVQPRGGSGELIVPNMGGAPSSSGVAQCTPGNTTTISGIVYDPAGKNPLYNISVYVLDPSRTAAGPGEDPGCLRLHSAAAREGARDRRADGRRWPFRNPVRSERQRHPGRPNRKMAPAIRERQHRRQPAERHPQSAPARQFLRGLAAQHRDLHGRLRIRSNACRCASVFRPVSTSQARLPAVTFTSTSGFAAQRRPGRGRIEQGALGYPSALERARRRDPFLRR